MFGEGREQHTYKWLVEEIEPAVFRSKLKVESLYVQYSTLHSYRTTYHPLLSDPYVLPSNLPCTPYKEPLIPLDTSSIIFFLHFLLLTYVTSKAIILGCITLPKGRTHTACCRQKICIISAAIGRTLNHLEKTPAYSADQDLWR